MGVVSDAAAACRGQTEFKMKGKRGSRALLFSLKATVFKLHYCMGHDLAFSDFGQMAPLRLG